MFDVKALAAEKRLETQHDEVDWAMALENARMSLKHIDLDSQTLELLARASRSPAKFTSLVRLMYQYGKAHPFGTEVRELLLENVNRSPFALADWIDAIDYFYAWLLKNQRKVDFLPMMKYLECCVAAPGAGQAGQTLSALCADMLDVCGYVG